MVHQIWNLFLACFLRNDESDGQTGLAWDIHVVDYWYNKKAEP